MRDFKGKYGLTKVLMHPVTAVAGFIGLFFFVHYMDTRWAYVPYTLAVTLALATILFVLSSRPYSSLYAAGIFTVLQAFASLLKYNFNGLALHIYDVIFNAGDWSLFQFLIEFYKSLLLFSLLALLASIGFLVFIFKAERPVRYRWALRAAAVPVALMICVGVFPRAKTHDSEYLPFTAGYNASALYFSLTHVPYLVTPPPISARLADVKIDKPFDRTVECGPQEARPDVYVVLQESQAPLNMFPELTVPTDTSRLFSSGDGKVHPLHVETFGAGTWMTNFSVLTGLSTADFGWQAPYVNKLMEGRVHGALPEVFARCGYRTIAMMTLRFHAINEGPFLTSLGFGEVFDADGMGFGTHGVRDSNYFQFVNKLIAEHRKTDKRPLFIAMQTMFTHSPYLESLVPVSELVEKLSGDPEANEYGRRVLISRNDFQHFLKDREQDAGPQGTVIAEFGDHQAIATKRFVKIDNLGDSGKTDFTSKMYETFFSVHAYDAKFDYAQLDQPQDVGFFMAKVLAAGNLPTSPVFQDLARLSTVCAGRFHLCPQREEIDRHLKRRVEGGMLLN